MGNKICNCAKDFNEGDKDFNLVKLILMQRIEMIT